MTGQDIADRADMELAKDMYYEALGWDKKTGNPTRAKLAELGLEFAARDFS